MKTLLVLSAAVAAASAEADPQFLYHGYAPAAYYNPFLYPTLKKVEMPKMEKEEEMKVEDSDLKTPLDYRYSPYGFTGSPYSVHPYAFNYPYAYHPYATYAPYVPVVKAAEEKKVEKREADPYLVYNHAPLTYTHTPLTYTHTPLTYNPYVQIFTKTAPTGCQNHMGAAVPCAYGNVVAPDVVTGFAPASADEDKKMEKREAEADPEAWWYGNYYNNVYAYGHHAYSPYYANAYYAPYHYGVGGCRNNNGAVVPCA